MAATPAITPTALVTANRAVVYGTVARWLMHDIRSPAQALSLVTELLAEPGGETDPDLQRTLCESTRQLTRCVELLDRALRVLPSPAGPEPVVVADVLNMIGQYYSVRRGGPVLDLAGALGQRFPAVAASSDYVEHALLNLVMNAVEAVGEQHGGRVTVTGSVAEQQLELVVDDNGPGIADDVREGLFEPYVTTKPVAGRVRGLGLTVARHLAERYGGSVVYLPKDEPGARFAVRLPLWPAARS